MFLKIALAAEVKKTTGQTQRQVLSNPQLLNSYAYTANNPVKYTDPDGEFLFLIPAIPYIFTGAVALLGAYSAWQTGQTAGYALEGDYVNSEVSAAKNQLALTAIAALGEGALAAMPLTVTNSSKLKQSAQNTNQQTIIPGQKITSLEQVPEKIKSQVPNAWGTGRQADNKNGWVWTDPKHTNNEIRYMTGKPGSQFETQQNPYMVIHQEVNGQRRYLDVNGNIGIRESAETHFDPEQFNINNYQF